MRIISKFRDYYDCVQAMGQDSDTIYIRDKKEVVLDEFPFPTRNIRQPYGSVYMSQFVIGFCGKIYPVVKLSNGYASYHDRRLPESCTKFCYNLAEIDAYYDKYVKKKEVKEYQGTGSKWSSYTKRKEWKAYFEEYAKIQGQFEDIFRTNNTPIFVAHYGGRYSNSEHTIIYNGELKSMEFYRIFDTYTAFQEIAMYVGGILGMPSKPIPEVSDKDMVTAKGFNKWSFRKLPRKKK